MPMTENMLDLAATTHARLEAAQVHDRRRPEVALLEKLAQLVIDLHEREHERAALYCHPACRDADRILSGRWI